MAPRPILSWKKDNESDEKLPGTFNCTESCKQTGRLGFGCRCRTANFSPQCWRLEDLLQSEIIYHLNSFDNNTWPHLESHFDVDESYRSFASERPKAYDAYSRVPGTKKMVQMVQ